MALYKGKPVMIGAYETYGLDELDSDWTSLDWMDLWRSNASYFETFDIETEEWSDLTRNPFFNESTRWYWEGTSVTKDDSFLVFGGRVGFYSDKSSQIDVQIHSQKSNRQDSFKNKKVDIYCYETDRPPYINCNYQSGSKNMPYVLEYKNDVWKKLGQLVGAKHVSYASGLSMQNQLMIVGGTRGYEDNLNKRNPFALDFSEIKLSYLFDEDTGESQIIPDMGFINYVRPLMILVDHDFCQGK